MRKFLILSILAFSLILTPSASAQLVESLKLEKIIQPVDIYTFENQEDFKVRFFPYNDYDDNYDDNYIGPNINEFLKGYKLVKKTIKRITDKGFIPTVDELEIGISSDWVRGTCWDKNKGTYKCLGGYYVQEEEDGKLLVSIKVPEDTLERRLLKFFKPDDDDTTFDEVTYFFYTPYSFPYIKLNMAEFFSGVDLVNRTIKKFKDAGFVMKVERFEVEISPTNMRGGPIVAEEDGKLLVSIKVPQDTLERHLLKFFVWPN